MSQEGKEVLSILEGFMSAMRDWECAYSQEQRALINSNDDTSECDAKYEHKLKEIFEYFSVSKGRNWARLVDLGCGSPPTYDPTRDIIDVPILTGKIYTVIVQQTVRLKAKYKFYLQCIEGRWLIVKKETQDGVKWKSTAF